MAEPIIKTVNLSKTYGLDDGSGVKALDNVNLEVYESEIIGITGPSGSGKTTLLGVIGCLESPTSGELMLFGKDVGRLTDKQLSEIRLRRIGFIFQEHNLLPALTVHENLELPLYLAQVPRHERMERVKELLEVIDLEYLSSRFPSQLSRGQRQRIAAIRAFVNNPKIILGDEPTSDLDRENASILMRFLKRLNEENQTTIVLAATDEEAFHGVTGRGLHVIDGKVS